MRAGPGGARRVFDHGRHPGNADSDASAETGLRRAHLVEATAPGTLENAVQIRPWHANVLRLGGPNIHLARHNFVLPLVCRLVHPGSGTSDVGQGGTSKVESDAEYQRLIDRFGRIPW